MERGINNVVGIIGIAKSRPSPPTALDGERECCVLLSYPLLSLVRSLACLLLHFQAQGHKMFTGITVQYRPSEKKIGFGLKVLSSDGLWLIL